MERVVDLARESGDKWAVLITLDVKNAFCSASWDKKMEKRGVAGYLQERITNYFKHRSVEMETEDFILGAWSWDQPCGMYLMTKYYEKKSQRGTSYWRTLMTSR